MQSSATGAAAPSESTAETVSAIESESPVPASVGLGDWFREGLRASLFLRPIAPAPEPAPLHLLGLIAVPTAFQLLVRRLVIPGGAEFSLSGWLAPWWSISVLLFVSWWLFTKYRDADEARPAIASWYGLLVVASWPLIVVNGAWEFAWHHGWLADTAQESPFVMWAFAIALWAWLVDIAVRIAAALGLSRTGLALLAVCIATLCVISSFQFANARPWYPTEKEAAASKPEGERFALSQETFESQQKLFEDAARALLPQRANVRDVYGIVFAPYGSEDVFLRESNLATSVLGDRFDAKGRILQLVNHVDTTKTHPWATPLNLRRAIEAVAARMDKEQDVLVIYLTSHGASDFKLSAAHWPLEVPQLTPADLRKALDDAGIRNRVIAISACYSGGWIEPLATETSLIMTAADATHTSYGCGRRSELTYFGRALWDEQLRRTHSFEDAFTAAVPIIKQREVDAKKTDGFSNPQIRVGPGIRPVLMEITDRLDKLATPATR